MNKAEVKKNLAIFILGACLILFSGEASAHVDDFSVEVQNLQNYPIDVNIETSNLSFSENLLSGEIKQIWFGIANQSEFMTINLSSENQGYEIFTHLFYTLPVTNETTNETQNNETNQTQGNETNQTNENTTIIEEDIIEEDDVIEDILTEDDVIEELGDIPAFENEGGVLETCSEKNGIVCEDDEKCEGETESAKEIICCLGVCNEVEKSNTGKIVGWILIILIAGVLIWLYIKKSKKKKKPVNLLKIAGNRK